MATMAVPPALAGPLATVPRTTEQPAKEPMAFRSVEQLQRTLYTHRDGVPLGIYAITQDKDGFLWVGGSSGLYRFDGVGFTRMFEAELPPILITALFVDASGDLWVGNLRGGIFRVHEGAVRGIRVEPGKAVIMAFHQRRADALWVGTAGGILEVTGDRLQNVAIVPPGMDRDLYVNLYATAWDGSYVVFAGQKAYRMRPGGAAFEEVDADSAMADLAGLAGDVSFSAPSADMLVDGYRALWVPTNEGLARYHMQAPGSGNELVAESVRFADGEPVDATADYIDRDGSVWVASSRGLEQFRAARFTPLTLPSGVYQPAITAEAGGALWVSSASAMSPLRVADSVASHPELGTNVRCSTLALDGAMWFSGDNELRRLAGDNIESLPLPTPDPPRQASKTPGRGCGGIAVGSAGDVWMALYKKTWHWTGTRWEKFGDKTPSTVTIQGNTVWIGWMDKTLTRVDGVRQRNLTKADGLDIGEVYASYPSRVGLWIGGATGLVLMHDGRFSALTGRNGGRYPNATDMVEFPNGDLWVITDTGLYRLPAAEIRLALEGPSHPVEDQLFDQDDGLRSTLGSVRGDPLEPGAKGRLWVAGDKDVAWIDPGSFAAPPPPTVVIDTVNGQSVNSPRWHSGKLNQGTRNVEIAFTAPTFAAPGRVHFRYVLEGIEDGWQDGGAQRRVHYSNLGPGQYTFRVQASDVDGRWPSAASVVAFRILPAFYQTWWFRILCIVLGLIAIWILYQRHLARIFAAHQTRLNERERIARDLHDSLLQQFQALLFHAHAASGMTEGPVRERFRRVIDIAEDALVDGREAIMGLRSVSDTLASLPNDVQKLSELIDPHHAIAVTVATSGTPGQLNPAVADDVHAIVHELVANALRHSGGKRVQVELRYDRAALVVIVTDDGRGMDGTVAPPAEHGRWGITGMRERARQVGGALVFGCAPGGGTQATLRIPARRAYRRRWLGLWR
ncbi:triple tyrosine motif-containing protein [Luteibacter sp.]|uniref:sensor histidine kinase n=1 Tax=Luteibacter sp. TaxID=1886636 RepID=UPI003F81F90E